MIPFDDSGAFHPVAVGKEFRRAAIRGAVATVSFSGLGFAVGVVSTVVLARLLTPADFGVVTMATTFSLLLSSFGLNGFTEAVIQFEEIDHCTASNLFWLSSGAGLFLAIAFVAAAHLLAQFYGNPLVAKAAMGLSVGIFLGATSVIHLALLKRAMSFTVTSSIDLVGRVVYTVVPIVLAARGWGYWSLVAGIVAQQVSMAIGVWWFCRWVPSLPRRTGKTGIVVRFAANVYGQFCLRYCSRNIDNLLVGWQFHAVVLGFYKKAYDLFALSASQLIEPLSSVALATLSRLNQDPARFRRYLTSALGIIAMVGMAVSAELTLVGKDVVRLVLGPQWTQSVRIFELFGPGIGAMHLGGVVSWIHLAIGKPERLLRWTVVELSLTVSLFLAALPFGPGGIAAAWSISYWILLIPGFWYAGRPIGFGTVDLISAVWRFPLAALAAGLATTAVMQRTPHWDTPSGIGGALEAIIIISTVFAAFYVGTVVLLHRGCGPLRQLVSLMREVTPLRKLTRRDVEPIGEV